MLLTPTRYVQILPVICAVCHLTLTFPIQTPSAHDDVRQLKLDIPHSGPILVPLGSSISIPCFVSLSSSSSSSPSAVPRVKWTVVSGGIETQILVARSSRVKINEAYRDRVALLNYTSSPEDVSLWLGDLRHSDSGHYRCEVQQGLEDASKVVQIKVKGVVFHYRDALGRYSFSFQQAQRACEGIGAQVATPDQLLAAYFDGYEQCDAGWLADQSVRYPIQVPREGCYGDMDGQPGVRNYGTMDPDDLFDVYCYIEQIHGKVFYDPIPQQLSFDEAQSYCGAAGAQLATTAQLYSAWSEGLDRCSPGWLSDGSVRYPIVIPRERCGGPQAGVKTLYRFSNQTGFPEPSALHDVYCFKGHGETSTDSPVDNLITEAENLQQNVVILVEREEEIHLNQLEKQVEREAQSELESLPLLPDSFTTEDPLDRNQTVTSDRTESFPTTPYTLDFLKPLNESTEIHYDSQHLPEAAVSTISTTKTFDSTQSTTISPGDYNGTDLHQNLSFTFHTSEFERSTYEPQTENQTASDTNSTEYLQSTEQTIQYQEIQETSLHKSHTNYSETKNNRTDVDAEKAFWEGTTLVAGPLLQVKLEDATTEDPVQMDTTQTTQDKRTPATQETPTTKLTVEAYSIWTPIEGSGDISQEREFEMEAATFMSSSQSAAAGFTAKPLGSAVASTTPQREAPDPTLSSVSRHVDKLDFEIHTTTPDLWELTISRQEGSTSLDTEEVDATQAPQQVVSGVSLPMTESPEDFNVSHSPSEFATKQYQTLGSSYEEASGSELGTVNSIFQEGIKVASPFEKTFIVSPTHGKEENKSTSIEEEAKSFSTAVPIEVANASQSTEEIAPTLVLEVETKVTPTVVLVEEGRVSPTLGLEDSKVVPALVAEEEAKGISTTALGEVVNITATAALEEDTKIASTPVFEGETKPDPNVAKKAKITTTLVSEEEALVDPTVVLDEETKVSPTLVLEEVKVAPVLVTEEDTNIEPTVAEKAKIRPTLFPKEAIVDPSFVPVEEGKVSPTLVVEENKVVPALVVEEEANVDPTVPEEANVHPTLVPEQEAHVDPTVVPVEEAKVSPTLVVEENKVVPALVVEEEAHVDPTVVPVEEAKVSPTLVVEENKVVPALVVEEEANVDPTVAEEAKVHPTLVPEQEAHVDPTVVPVEEAKVSPTLVVEENKVVPALVVEEEANVDPTVAEEAKVHPTLVPEQEAHMGPTVVPVEEAKVSPTLLVEENKVVPALVVEEETHVDPTVVPVEEAKVSPTFVVEENKVVPALVVEEEAHVDPTVVPVEEAKVSPTLVVEENKVVPGLVVEEEANVDPTVAEEAKVHPTLVPEQEAHVDPAVVPVEEAKVSPTLVVEENKVAPTAALEEDSKTASTLAAEEEFKVDPEIIGETSRPPTLGLEEEANVDPTPVLGVVIDEESRLTPNITFEEKAKVDSTLVLEEEASFTPNVKEEAQVDPTLIYEESKSTQIPLQEEEVNVLKFENSEEITNFSGAPEEEYKVTPTFVTDELKVTPILNFEKETDVAPTLEDFTIFPVNTQTSKWSLLTTTTGPQEHLNSVKISQKPPFMSVSEPSMNTKSMSSAPTISTPTYVPQRTWSPRTTRPPTFHKTTETQKVNHFMPALDHGLIDLDISLTQPPTLHNLPKERAAVGGTGAFSDACLDNPCLNGGTCTERDGHIKCLCLPTYGGRFCQSDLERCEPGWDKFHGFCYRHFSQRQTWEVAERHCRTQGAHLVSIMTPEEQDYINSNYKEYQWTGLNDKTVEDDFRWSDGNPLLYENWYRGQPDSYFLSGEDCVVMVWHDNGRWSDVPCNYHLAYTCKKGTSSCGPPPKVRNASIFGKMRVRYETNAVVRYRCSDGFQQRLNPVVRCLSGGRWERPQILCIPEGGEILQHLGMLSQTDSHFSAAETEFEATKETPQYWDIKF